MQIYMENIIDLLDDNNRKLKRECLQIREDPKTGIYVDGLIQVSVSSLNEVIALIKEGVRNRLTYSTTMVPIEFNNLLMFVNEQNKASSRSHAVLQVFFEQRWIEVKREADSDSSKEIKKVGSKCFPGLIREVEVPQKGTAHHC